MLARGFVVTQHKRSTAELEMRCGTSRAMRGGQLSHGGGPSLTVAIAITGFGIR